MTHADKVRSIALFNHLMMALGLWYVFDTEQYFYLVVSALMFAFVAIVCVNISLHRYLSHHSFKTGSIRHKFLIYCSVISAFGSPVSWCAMHRYHHATSGGPDDNQSPKNIGVVRAWLTLYSNVSIPASMIKDIVKDADCKFVHQHYFKILLGWIVLLAAVDPRLVVFAFCIPAAMAYQAAGAFAVIPHKSCFGYRVLPNLGHDDSVNSPLASVLSLGEGWHNYHHTRPSDHRHGHGPWEFDPPAWVIEKFFLIK